MIKEAILTKERKVLGNQVRPPELGRASGASTPSWGRCHPPEWATGCTGGWGGREGPLSLPLGKYSGHSFRKYKDSVFPLLLNFPHLGK